ncbi:MAG: right-handed parallel beta-helix repeat-containing protein [Thermoplasmatota archaeon]
MNKGSFIILTAILIMTQAYLVSIPGDHYLSGEKIIIDEDSTGYYYTVHTPIRINNESDLDSDHGVTNPSAAGTKSDPYIIDGWSISGRDKEPCVYIGNTTSHIVISNCTFRQASGNYNYYYWDAAIAGFNTANITVEYCVFQNTNIRSIYAEYCRFWDINNNTLDTSSGLWIHCGFDLYVNDNDFSNSGLVVQNTNETILKRNTFDHMGRIYLHKSNRSLIYNNDLTTPVDRDYPGISLYYSRIVTIMDNKVNKSDESGIHIYSSTSITLENNRCWDIIPPFNTEDSYGISISYSADLRVSNNTCFDNYHGIFCDGPVFDSVFFGNDISNNHRSGMMLYGRDNLIDRNTCIYTGGSPYYKGTGFILDGMDRSVVTDNTVSEQGGFGIHIIGQYNEIRDNELMDNADGIEIVSSLECEIHQNVLIRSGGIRAYRSSSNEIHNNSISQNEVYGVRLHRSDDNRIADNTITNTLEGIVVRLSEGNVIFQNEIQNDRLFLNSNKAYPHSSGIHIEESVDNVIKKNDLTMASIYIEGDELDQWTSNSIVGNEVNGRFVLVVNNLSNWDYSSACGEIILINCSFMDIHDLSFTGGTMGIQVAFSDNISVYNITLVDQIRGVSVYRSKDMTMENISMSRGVFGLKADYSPDGVFGNFSILNYTYGMEIRYCDGTTIADSSVVFNSTYGEGINAYRCMDLEISECEVRGYYGAGIILFEVEYGSIMKNIVSGNRWGLYFDSGNIILDISNNTLSSNLGSGVRNREWWAEFPRNKIFHYNHIADNGGYGIETNGVGDFYHHNNFIGNNDGGIQISDNGTANRWNTSSGEGNFWGDYSSRYPTAGSNGKIWNTPYQIDGSAGSSDHYPLVNIVDLIPPKIEDLTDDICTTGDPFVIRAEASDNIGVEKVTVEYWFGDRSDQSETLMMVPSGGVFETLVLIPDTSDPFNYILTAFDSNGNTGISPVKMLQVVDNDDPVSIPGDDMEIGQGDTAFFNGSRSVDNIGITNFSWWFLYDDMGIELNGNNVSFTFLIPGKYEVHLNVSDAFGNWDNESMTVDVRDTAPPEITLVNTNLTVDHRDQFTVLLNVSDHSGISGVRIIFIDLSNESFNGSMGLNYYGQWFFDIPAQEKRGVIDLYFWSGDLIGNEIVIGPYPLQIFDNVYPVYNVTYPRYAAVGSDLMITAQVYDLSGVQSVSIRYMDSSLVPFTESMDIGDDGYMFHIPARSEAGDVIFQIIILDGSGFTTVSEEFTIHILPGIQPVIVDPGENVTIIAGSTYQFNSSAFRGNGEFTYISWIFDYGGSQVILEGFDPSFLFEIPGVYEVYIKAMDSLGEMGYGYLTITVLMGDRDDIIVTIGPIVDIDGNIIEGAAVTIRYMGDSFSGTTDEGGVVKFAFPAEASGRTVVITISADGYEDETYSGIITEDGMITPEPPSLKPKEEVSMDMVIMTVCVSTVLVVMVVVIAAFFLIGSGRKSEVEIGDVTGVDLGDGKDESDLSSDGDQAGFTENRMSPPYGQYDGMPPPSVWGSRPPIDDEDIDEEDSDYPGYEDYDAEDSMISEEERLMDEHYYPDVVDEETDSYEDPDDFDQDSEAIPPP